MTTGLRTDRGRVRPNNEDSVLVDPDLGLLIVADGMGGAIGGEIASAIAVEATALHLRDHAGGSTDDARHVLLRDAVFAAHEAIRRRAGEQPELSGMGSTVVVALLTGDRLHLASVGDSRAYLLRDGTIRQLTDDQSVVAQAVMEGVLSAPDARTHPLRHVLSQALGASPALEPCLRSLEVDAGDVVLLCTDGLTGPLDDEAILGVLGRYAEPQAACDELVRQANARGGHDNVTVAAALVGSEGRP
jgi:protein phosphatase